VEIKNWGGGQGDPTSNQHKVIKRNIVVPCESRGGEAVCETLLGKEEGGQQKKWSSRLSYLEKKKRPAV